MTLVDAATGEIIPTATPDQARDLTDRIKVAVEGSWHLIKQAYETRCWAALGYSSWDDYCTREFGASRLRLPREDRQEVVASLRDSGLSIRAIASVTGNNKETVQKDLQVYGNRTPDDVEPRFKSSQKPKPESKKVTGTDGKKYAGPKPKTPNRPALPDAAQKAGWEFRRAVERVERIAADDRFSANREQVAAQLRGHLEYAVEVCQDLLDAFDNGPQEDR